MVPRSLHRASEHLGSASPLGDSSSGTLAREFSRNLLQTLTWEVSWLFLS